jgi:hypothetical protein
MKTMLAGLNSLFLCFALNGAAMAQEQPSAPPPAPQAPPMQAAPAPEEVEAAAVPAVYSYPTGRWVYTSDARWVWVPAGATSVSFRGAPYAYLYTPSLGWAWRVSPWGWGGYRYGAWVGRPWRGPAWRGGWAAHPHAVGRGGYGHYGHRR